MNRLIYITACLLLVFSTGAAQERIWQKSYGGVYSESGYDIVATSDGGFLAVGSTQSFKSIPTATNSGYLVRTDAAGDLLWQKAIGGYDRVDLRIVLDNGDDTYTVIGDATVGDPLYLRLMYMALVDDQGSVVWERLIGDSLETRFAIAASRHSSGGIIVLGRSQFGKPYVVHLDDQGEMFWERTYELATTGQTMPRNMRELADGSLMIVGVYSHRMYMLKITAAGDSLWKRDYYSSGARDEGRDILEKPDGTLHLIGYSEDVRFSPGGHLYIIHTDASGGILDTMRHVRLPRNEIVSAERTFDGGMMLIGLATDEHGSAAVYFVRTDSHGKILWESTHRSDLTSHIGIAVRQLDDGGFVAVGRDGLGILITRISDRVSAVEDVRLAPATMNLW